MKPIQSFFSLSFIALSFLSTALYALPFTILPIGVLPATVPSGGTASASYTIKNVTSLNAPNNLIKYLPPNVLINPNNTTCAPQSAFSLTPGQSCILNLTISGPVDRNDSHPQHHLFVCLSDNASCAGPSPENSLNVTMGTAISYVAVGYYLNGSQNVPSSFTSADGGKNWMLSTTLPPAQGVGDHILNSVFCNSSKDKCTTVGYYLKGSQNIPLSYNSTDSGKTWTLSTTLPPTQGAGDHILKSVTCDSNEQQCLSVGYYFKGTIYIPLSYTSADGGKNWTPSVTMPPAQGVSGSFLNGVACDSSAQRCTAVGYYSNGSQNIPLSYISLDSGKNWTLSTTLPPAQGTNSNVLYNVACNSSGLLCLAVGYYISGGRDLPLTYLSTDGGENWTVTGSTLPSPQGTGDNVLLSVACDSTWQLCITAGSYSIGSQTVPLSYTTLDGGKNWTISTTLPAVQGTGDNGISSVACDSSGLQCAAIGEYTKGGREFLSSFTSTDGGKNWTTSDTQPPAQGTGDNEFSSIA